MASFETEPPPAHPSDQARRRSGIFIAVFVALQFLVPLTYLVRDDGSDERFTWRSFGTPPTQACDTRASLRLYGGERHHIPVEQLIHEDWVRYVQQGRLAVVDAFLLKQCEANDVEQVDLVNRCDDERATRSYSLRCGGEHAHETTRTAAR